MAALEPETYPPLPVDANAPLTFPITGKLFQLIGRWQAQILDPRGGMYLTKAHRRPLQNFCWQPPRLSRSEEALSFGIGECLNHGAKHKQYVYALSSRFVRTTLKPAMTAHPMEHCIDAKPTRAACVFRTILTCRWIDLPAVSSAPTPESGGLSLPSSKRKPPLPASRGLTPRPKSVGQSASRRLTPASPAKPPAASPVRSASAALRPAETPSTA